MAKFIYLGCEKNLRFCEDHKLNIYNYIEKQGENRKLTHLHPANGIIAPPLLASQSSKRMNPWVKIVFQISPIRVRL